MTKRLLLFVLILLNLAIIFFFSHQDSVSSGQLSSALTSQIKVHTPHYTEKTQAQQKVVHTQIQYTVRGLAHGFLFFTLGILMTLFGNTFSHRWYQYLTGNILLGFFIALSDEIHQIFVPGRTFGWDDILYDSLGYLLGIAAAVVMICLSDIHKKRTETR
ncbi:MAG: VanZ family protein [Clostridia bacterium]|nr:VanZ family protein [Clostridia bacterium]